LTIVQPTDRLSLLKLYLSVFHPSILADAKSMLEEPVYKRAESEFSLDFRPSFVFVILWATLAKVCWIRRKRTIA
jgi:hypothetical protein